MVLKTRGRACAAGPSATAATGGEQLADLPGSAELRSINVDRQGSDLSSAQTPPSRYTPSALLLPGGGHSSQNNSPMRSVAEGVHTQPRLLIHHIRPDDGPTHRMPTQQLHPSVDRSVRV